MRRLRRVDIGREGIYSTIAWRFHFHYITIHFIQHTNTVRFHMLGRPLALVVIISLPLIQSVVVRDILLSIRRSPRSRSIGKRTQPLSYATRVTLHIRNHPLSAEHDRQIYIHLPFHYNPENQISWHSFHLARTGHRTQNRVEGSVRRRVMPRVLLPDTE